MGYCQSISRELVNLPATIWKTESHKTHSTVGRWKLFSR